MKIKVSEATPPQINYLVAKCEGIEWESGDIFCGSYGPGFAPATVWGDGGPIIERERITIDFFYRVKWAARIYVPDEEPWIFTGPTPLVAAMKCYVASKLGDEVDVPDELI